METGEFIDGPCRWDRRAPERLRRRVFGDGPGWRSYSTSRYLVGLDPCILHSFPVAGSVDDGRVHVELLPAVLVRRWRDLGLRFATTADVEEMEFLETMEKALDLIGVVPPLEGSVAGMCRSVHMLLASDRDLDVSCSDPSLPFSVFVSCPPRTGEDRIERLAENLVHEALHLQLSLVEAVQPLLVEVRDEETVRSPWKGEGRTVRGLIHAVYVFGNLRFLWRRVASSLPGSSLFSRTRVETIEGEMSDAVHLVRSRSLTAAGRRLVTSFLGSCPGPLPAQARGISPRTR